MKTFRALSLPYLKDVYQLIDKACTKHGIEFYLIGAQARDIHLLEKAIQPIRGTMDIDFAIMLPDLPTFDIPTDHFELAAGARLLGRDMNPIVARSEKLKLLILQIINDRLAGTIGDLSKYSKQNFGIMNELDKQLLEQMKKGINETSI